MLEPDIYYVFYKNSAMTVTIFEHEALSIAKEYLQRMIDLGIYTEGELHIAWRQPRFGEGDYE